MLVTFICMALALAAAGLASVVVPLVTARRAGDDRTRREENLAILRRQFSELVRDYEEGRIPQDEYEETRSEIEARTLEETETAGEAAASVRMPKKSFLLACVCAVVLPVCSFLIYLQLGSPQAMDPAFVSQQLEMAHSHGGGHSDAEMMEQIKRLEERLKQNPDNPDGWLMLARANAAFRNWEASSKAYEELDRLVPNNADVLADWADVLAVVQGRSLKGRPEEMIRRALEIDPTHWKALALMGTLCFDTGDYKGAVDYWERMRATVEQGSEEWSAITDNIEEARKLGGLPAGTSGVKPVAAGGAKPAAPARSFVTGTVELAPELAARVKPDDSVFIFARPTSGSKMPVALVRINASELPAPFRLDGASRMGMGVKSIEDVDEVFVEARISRSGNFMPQPGDLEGAAPAPVKTGTTGVRVVIDRAMGK